MKNDRLTALRTGSEPAASRLRHLRLQLDVHRRPDRRHPDGLVLDLTASRHPRHSTTSWAPGDTACQPRCSALDDDAQAFSMLKIGMPFDPDRAQHDLAADHLLPGHQSRDRVADVGGLDRDRRRDRHRRARRCTASAARSRSHRGDLANLVIPAPAISPCPPPRLSWHGDERRALGVERAPVVMPSVVEREEHVARHRRDRLARCPIRSHSTNAALDDRSRSGSGRAGRAPCRAGSGCRCPRFATRTVVAKWAASGSRPPRARCRSRPGVP